MKLKSERKACRKRCKPFLVLPSIVIANDCSEENEDQTNMTNKGTGLKLFTKTWPPKRETKKKNPEQPARPLTATLDEPTILDIRLIGKIDMSKIRKEFLNISNICRMPLTLKTKKAVKLNRPLSLPPTEKRRCKKRVSDAEDSWEDEESSSIHSSARKTKNNEINDRIRKSETVTSSRSIKSNNIKSNNAISDANNNKTYKLPCKRSVPNGKLLNKNDLIKSTKLPEPCKTCGRPDQPERFHSHPVTPMKAARKMEGSPKIPVKSTVQKPIAIKYKSKTITDKKPSPIRKTNLPSQKVQTPSNATTPRVNSTAIPPKPVESVPRIGSAKRTLTCYLCGREFGTASLPLHEPKCLQKWERENANLPSHLRRKPPPKPDSSASKEEWNKLAWESSQATLTPCYNCGRTFYPDRLIVHQRSCKTPQPNIKISYPDSQSATHLAPMSLSTPTTPSGRRPPSVECYICGKMFGSNSIKIHERQCLKKWNVENDSLPPDMRSPPPSRNSDNNKIKSPVPQQNHPSSTDSDRDDRPKSARKPPLFPCYICGKLFTVNSIYIHEPQCLKKWKIENDKLPPNRRRPQPLKPDIKFTHDGKIDYESTNEANWQSHLSQLVPCKMCSRTFNPDRVEVHERSCKGC